MYLGPRLAAGGSVGRPVVVNVVSQELLVDHSSPRKLVARSAAPGGSKSPNTGAGRAAAGTTGSASLVPVGPSRKVAVAG